MPASRAAQPRQRSTGIPPATTSARTGASSHAPETEENQGTASGTSPFNHLLSGVVYLCTRLTHGIDSIALIDIAASTALRAFEAADHHLGVQAAVAWASGFEFPQWVYHRNVDRLQAAGGDLVRMTDQVQLVHRPSHFSAERVRQLVPPDYPDFDILLQMATEGMSIFRPPDFCRVAKAPPFRRKYLLTAPAVHKMLLASLDDDKVFCLPTATLEGLPDVHFQPLSWAEKANKASGRQVVDSSDDSHGSCLNSPAAKTWAEENIGPIHHPTLDEIMRMILGFFDRELRRDPSFTWAEVVLFKEDLAQAFTLLHFKPADAGYMSVPLANGWSIVAFTGTFGWTIMPFFFNKITLVLKFLVHHRIYGLNEMYVDDSIGVTTSAKLLLDQAATRACCRELLGPSAIADHKSIAGRRLDIIGYDVDLDSLTVSISESTFNKMVYIYFTVDTDLGASISVLELQRLGSYAARFQRICRVMRPFTHAFYSNMRGYTRQSVRVSLESATRRSIWAWRAMFVMMRWDRRTFTRTFDSFRFARPSYLIQFDASLTGAGAILSRLNRTDSSTTAMGVLRAVFPFRLDSSAYQNSAEFIAIVYGLIALVRCGVSNCSIHLIGDSVSALSWADKESFKGEKGNGNMYIVYALLCTKFNLHVGGTTLLKSEENIIPDALSRDLDVTGLGPLVEDANNYFTVDQWNQNFLRSLDPTSAYLDDVHCFLDFWAHTDSAITECGRAATRAPTDGWRAAPLESSNQHAWSG